ncbi:MAG: ABC transporter substrate-binding protein [Candidatus Auribacterota bacterium]
MSYKLFFILLFALCIPHLPSFAQQPIEEGKTLRDFILPPSIDIFNDRVSDVEHTQQKPKPGGTITIRLPIDPKSLNPITDNDAQSQNINSFLFDSLITRHSETLEWLPWIAKRWEERDLVVLKDGSMVEGRIVEINETALRIIQNTGKVVVGKHDTTDIDFTAGTLSLNDGTTFSGRINELTYTIEIEPPLSAPIRDVAITDIADQTDQPGKKQIIKNGVYYFIIRDTAKWHDGVTVTVDDILFSYTVLKNKYVDAAPLRNYYQDLKDVTIIDKQTVKFTYGKSYFLSLSFCGGMTILPKHIYNPDQFGTDEETFGTFFNQHTANRHPIGNSAYRFVEWEKGKQIVIEKVPDYWASACNFPYWEKEQPYLDKIIWMVINNKTAALKELQNGTIDADFDIEPDIWFSDQTNSESFVSTFARADMTIPLYTYIGWNQLRPFFQDPSVRRAMTHLIPREKIANEIHRGLVEIVTGPFFINGPVYDKSIQPYEYSVKEAKRLLRKAGWLDHDGDGIIDKDGVPFKFEYLIHNAKDYHQKIADIVKESIEKAGIQMIIRKIDWTVFSETVADRKFDAVRFAWGTGIDGDPYQIWHSSQAENRGSNYIGYNNPRVDQILVEAREEFDPVKRWTLYREMHHILHEEQPYTFLFCFKTLFFYNKKFQNVKIYSTSPGYNLREWYIADNEPQNTKKPAQ